MFHRDLLTEHHIKINKRLLIALFFLKFFTLITFYNIIHYQQLVNLQYRPFP